MVRRIAAYSLSLLVHGLAVAAALMWTAPAGPVDGTGAPLLRMVDTGERSAPPGVGYRDPGADGIERKVEALRGLAPAEQLALLEERAARARRKVRIESVGEIATFLGLPVAAALETEASALGELDFASLTIVDIQRVANAGYRVRAADARGRWTWIEIDDPEDRHLWAAAEEALRMVRGHPVLDAIYARCVLPLLAGMERDPANAGNAGAAQAP